MIRLFPVVSNIGRKVTEDTVVDGHLLKKGLNVNILIHMIHRDEKYYPDPEKFDPERFLPENTKDRHPFAFVPFSAGKRNCIGQKFAMMELKVLLSGIFRKFSMQSSKKIEELMPSLDIILKPLHGLPVKLALRKKD